LSDRQRDLAVVIVNYNTADHLAACLGSLMDGGLRDTSAEVWVVDNASADSSAELVKRQFPNVRLIESQTNIGYASANNLALRAAGFEACGDGPNGPGQSSLSPKHARHVQLLNPDTIVPPGSLAKLIDCLEEADDIGVVGPKLIRPDGSLDLACRRSFPTPEVSLYRFSGLAKLFPRSRRFGRYNLTYLDPDVPVDVDSVVGACMLVRGEAIGRVGLLDERFWMYGEDLDWSLRIRKAGWRVVYRPQVTIEHAKRAASAGSSRAHYEFQRAMWLFYKKHYADQTSPPLSWLVLAGIAARGGRPLIREMIAARGSGP
jgi:GT2 family glycosyltransferase